jgi:hypothetical protein
MPDLSLITSTYTRPDDGAILYLAGGQWYESKVTLRAHTTDEYILILVPTENPYAAKVHQIR